MGNILGGYSNSKKHCLVEFPHVKTHKKETVVTIRLQLVYNDDGTRCWLVPESRYPYESETQTCYFMEQMHSELNTTQKAIIMGIYILMVQNELKTDIELPLRRLFHIDESFVDTSGKCHPDKTGKITIMFESEQRGIQRDDKQLLYESTAENDGALQYAGLEQRFLEPRSIPINDSSLMKGKQEEEGKEEEEGEEDDSYELFTDDDEMIKFISEHKRQFQPTWNDIHKVEFEEKDLQKDVTHYRVSKEFLSKVRRYFKEVIFMRLHYTEFTETRLGLEMSDQLMQKILAMHPKPENDQLPSPSLFFAIQFNYIVITTGSASVGPKVFKRHHH